MTHNDPNPDADLRANTCRSALLCDLYELTMAQAYLVEGMEETAVFQLAFRTLPAARNYVMACGVERALSWLEALRFTTADHAYLEGLQRFSGAFLKRLEILSFSGDVYAMPEGTVVFPNQPVIQVIAPIIEAQLVETWILNQFHCASVFASKAARVVTAAQGRAVVDFGARRAHGFDAANGARELHRGCDGGVQRGSRALLRHPGGQHHGAQLHSGARRRARGV